MIREIFINAVITQRGKKPVTIVDDPSLYDSYKKLGLGYIFKEDKAEPKKMSFPSLEKSKEKREVKTADEKLEGKTKKELLAIIEEKGLDADIQMPKKLLIEIASDSNLPDSE